MPLMRQGSYIAFSLQTDARQVARWQQALDEMNTTGAWPGSSSAG
jgi:polar amino acid transport system substrate-binding protein